MDVNDKYPVTIEGEWGADSDYMSADEVATQLVKLYAKYYHNNVGWEDDDMKNCAKAVGIAIRMLTD